MPPAISDKIPCESIEKFEQELVTLGEALAVQETEETWDRIARALTRFGAIVKGGGYKFDRELVNGVKASAKHIASAINSERTRLSAVALECIGIIAPRIGLAFEPLVPLLVPHILRLASRPNKVYVARSQATLGLILGYCHIPSIIPHLLVACKESKGATGRAVALESVLRCLNKWDWAQRDIKAKVGDIEETIRITGRDKDAGIRQTSRHVFEAYKILFPERVEEFTGPLTPVMRKYLNVKPLPHGQKPMERLLQQSAAEKPKRSPTRQRAHARSASSNAVVEKSSGNSTSNPSDGVTHPRSMPPPATIPTHARNKPRSQTQLHTDNQQEGSDRYERQRVVSTASSTYSTKSAPPDSHPIHQHRPPVRLVASQNHSSRGNPVVAASSGKARRVQQVVPVEPHPANRPDPLTMAHKAPVRATHPPNVNGPKVLKTDQGAALGITQSAPSSTTRLAFPTSEPACIAPGERKGAQRVPKHVPPPPGSAPVTPPKMEKPATVMGIASKAEVKPSVFRRGLSGKPGIDPKETEKKREGFVPRRGGGVTQPTLSQLNKQKPPASVNGVASHSLRPRAPVVSSRPVWGASGALKTGSTRGLPVSKGPGRDGIARALSAKLTDKPDVKPAMVPLPASPGREGEIMPQLVPLPASPMAEPVSEQTPEVPCPDKRTAEEPLAIVATANEVTEDVSEEPIIAVAIVDRANSPEQEEVDMRIEAPSDAIQNEAYAPGAGSILDAFVMQTLSPPSTPPFPTSIDGESEEDDLEGVEFTSKDTNPLDGIPWVTPRKQAVPDTGGVPERSPLADVVLNA